METIISALIAAGSSLIVCLITQAMQARKTEALIEYRLLKLEEKVDKHNNFAEKIPSMQTEINTLQKDVAQLKRYHMTPN